MVQLVAHLAFKQRGHNAFKCSYLTNRLGGHPLKVEISVQIRLGVQTMGVQRRWWWRERL